MYTYGLLQTLHVFAILPLITVVTGFNGRCSVGWTYFEDHCYRLERTVLSYTAAQTKCERAGASLVSITSAEENRFVTDLGILGKRSFYIGLNDYQTRLNAREGTFRWTDGTPFRYNGPSYAPRCPTNPNEDVQPTPTSRSPLRAKYCKQSELDYSNWNTNEPNNAGSRGEDCIHIIYSPQIPSKIGLWNDIHCSQTRYSMCKKDASEEGTVEETTIKCPHSFETFIELGTPTKSVSWSETPYLADSLASHVQKSHSPGVELTKGVTLVNYAFRDAYNLSVTCNFSISVIEVDTTPPSIQGCPSDVTLIQQPDEPIRVDWISPTASDLSGNVTLLSKSHTPGTTFDIGVNFVNYKFADSSGNEAECLFKLSVFGTTYSEEVVRPPSDTRINPDSAYSNQAPTSDDGLHNLISGLYVLVIVVGLASIVLLLLVLRNRNTGKSMSFVDSKSYSKMDEENMTD